MMRLNRNAACSIVAALLLAACATPGDEPARRAGSEERDGVERDVRDEGLQQLGQGPSPARPRERCNQRIQIGAWRHPPSLRQKGSPVMFLPQTPERAQGSVPRWVSWSGGPSRRSGLMASIRPAIAGSSDLT